MVGVAAGEMAGRAAAVRAVGGAKEVGVAKGWVVVAPEAAVELDLAAQVAATAAVAVVAVVVAGMVAASLELARAAVARLGVLAAADMATAAVVLGTVEAEEDARHRTALQHCLAHSPR